MIKLHGTVEIGENICISGFTFEYPSKTRPLVPLMLIGQREAILWAKKKLSAADKENRKALRELSGKPYHKHTDPKKERLYRLIDAVRNV